MSFSTVIREAATAPGYSMQLGSAYYCSRETLDYNNHTWPAQSFEVAGLATDGSASVAATITLLDRDQSFMAYFDANGIDDLPLNLWQMYVVPEGDNVYQSVFVGEVTGVESDGVNIKLAALAVRADYAITPRNRWVSSFSNVSAGSAVQIGDETLRFTA